MNETVNMFIVQVTNLVTDNPYKIVGVYTTKEKADAAVSKFDAADESEVTFHQYI